VPVAASTHAHRERALAGRRVRLDVAHVVDHQQRDREESHRQRRQKRDTCEGTRLHVGGTHRCHQPEEDEHGDLTQRP
jgi:hypothetical protein